VFEREVLTCISAGLVCGEEFAVAASLIDADDNKGRSIPVSEWSKERDPATAKRPKSATHLDAVAGGLPRSR
jgi:hypothetical protein